MDSRALGGWGLVLLGTVDGVYLDAVLVPRRVEVAPVAAPLSAAPAPPPARATIPPPPPPDADDVKEAASPNAWKAAFQTGSAERDPQHDLEPADPGHSDEAYARNRRVDVTLAGGDAR